MSNFKIGEKVVCVNNKNIELDEIEIEEGVLIPKLNQIYTIRQIIIDPDGIGFLLEEIVNPIFNYQGRITEAYFDSIRFRKLDHKFAEDICAELIADAKRETILN